MSLFKKISVLNLRLDKVMFRPKRYKRKRIKKLDKLNKVYYSNGIKRKG